MRRYEVLIPVRPNHGGEYLKTTRPNFLRAVANIAGGYTMLPDTEGFWRDPVSGKEYIETMTPVQVAIDAEQLPSILSAFRDAFPDQKSIMVTDTGSSEFYPGA